MTRQRFLAALAASAGLLALPSGRAAASTAGGTTIVQGLFVVSGQTISVGDDPLYIVEPGGHLYFVECTFMRQPGSTMPLALHALPNGQTLVIGPVTARAGGLVTAVNCTFPSNTVPV
jgi:hypothetical protein